MTPPVAFGHEGNELNLEIRDFMRVSEIAKSGWGLSLDEAKKPLIKSRLGKRVRALGISSFEEYCDLVDAGDVDERAHFISALTTNVTHFYREIHHFDYLETKVLPGLLDRIRKGDRLRIWSAGCSSGKEPYSIAASLLHVEQKAAALDVKILATDVDTKVLSIAMNGSYAREDCTFPSDAHRRRIFDPSGEADTRWQVRPELGAMITFRELNLMDDWPMKGPFDVIMCRNVAIYFDKPTQNNLWRRFRRYLRPGGYLFIGHSERITDTAELDLSMCHTTTYRLSI